MKALKCVLVLFSFVGLMLVGCSDQSQSPVSPNDQSLKSPTSLQKNIIRPFTGKEYPTSVVSPGDAHEASDGKTITKGVLFTTRFEATFSDGKPNLLTGNGFLELNSIFDINIFEGFTWGKLTVTPDNPDALGGVWEISWHGKMFLGPDPTTGEIVTICPLKWVGHGKGGAINGMQLHGDDIIKYKGPMNWYGDGGTNCYVKEHK